MAAQAGKPLLHSTIVAVHAPQRHRVMLLLALALILLHALANHQYGFHRNELDTLDNAQQLAWGYVAYPPLTPFFGWLELTLFGPSLAGVRLFAAIAMGIVLVLTGLMARDLGGRRPAQIIAALAAWPRYAT